MRTSGPAAVLAMVVIFTACGSSSSTSSVATSVAGGPDLSPKLLTVHDLPTGWSVYTKTSSSSSGTPDCLNAITAPSATRVAKAEAEFTGGASGVPYLDEAIDAFPAGKAHDALLNIDNGVTGCKNISVNENGTTLTGSVGAMSFPSFGDESNAYQISLSAGQGGITIGFDIVVVRKGDLLMGILLGDLGSPDVDTLQKIVQTAIAKV
jgi:hypothetical protein